MASFIETFIWMSEIREVKQLPLTLLLFFTVHQKSTADHQGSLEVQEPPKKRTGVWEKRWWTELLTSTIRIWQAFLQILGSNKVHTLWKMDHPKIPSIDSLPALFFCGQQLKAQRQRSFKDLGQIVKNSCQAITFMKTCKMSVKYFCNEKRASAQCIFLSLQPYNEVLYSFISPFNEITIIDICQSNS